jgi:peptidyl-dipeptidase A
MLNLRSAALLALLAPTVLLAAAPVQERADRFLALVNSAYQSLSRIESEAQWKAATDVKPEHDAAAEVAGKAPPSTATPPSSVRRRNCSPSAAN